MKTHESCNNERLEVPSWLGKNGNGAGRKIFFMRQRYYWGGGAQLGRLAGRVESHMLPKTRKSVDIEDAKAKPNLFGKLVKRRKKSSIKKFEYRMGNSVVPTRTIFKEKSGSR